MSWMANKQMATARAPAAKWGTGQRKAKKTTSTPKRTTTHRKKVESDSDEEGFFKDLDESMDVNVGDILMELPAKEPESEQDEGSDFLNNSEIEEPSGKKVRIQVPVKTRAVKMQGSESAAFDICFEVPYKNASRGVMISSDVNFQPFLERIVKRMEVSVTHLSQIGYILPWNVPKSGKAIPKLLDDEESFSLLMSNIRQHVDEQKAKNRGKGIVKPFAVTIIDTSQPSDDKGNTKKKKAALQPITASAENEEQDQQCKLIALIEEHHKCEEHGRACYVQSNGIHYQYTMEDIAMWASLLDRRLVTIDTPPNCLNLAEKSSRQAVLKRRPVAAAPAKVDEPIAALAAGSSNEIMPQWAQMMVAMMGGMGVTSRNNYVQFPPPSQPAYRSPSQSPDLAPRMLKRRSNSNESIEIDYPNLKSWLEALKNNPTRNKHSETFSQYASALVDTHRLYTLEDIITITAQDIATYGQMEFGTASQILRLAKEDVTMLKTQKKKLRQ